MFCPHCGTTVPEGASFCTKCGGSVPTTAEAPAPISSGAGWTPEPAAPGSWSPTTSPAPAPAPASPPPVSGPCGKCGARIEWPGGAWYCPACGGALSSSAERTAAPGSQGNKVCRQCNRVGPSTLTSCPHCGAAMGSGMGAGVVVGVVVVGGVLMIGMIGILAAILVPNFIRARGQGQFTACKSNLKNVGTALEMYSTDYAGRYPTSLQAVTPDYLKTIPTCPAVGTSTYLNGFESAAPVGEEGYDAYTVVCAGRNHHSVGAGANFPQYNSVQGLIER